MEYRIGGTLEVIHRWLAYTMLSVVLVHIAAVVKYRWFDDHDILVRMTISGDKNRKGTYSDFLNLSVTRTSCTVGEISRVEVK